MVLKNKFVSFTINGGFVFIKSIPSIPFFVDMTTLWYPLAAAETRLAIDVS